MKDARLKHLLVLGAVTLLFAGAAMGAVMLRARQGAAHFAPAQFLPGFSEQVKNAKRIHIAGRAGNFDVAYSEAKGWTLPAKGNYPADFEQVRHLLITLAALETIAPKTARADWLDFVDLGEPRANAGGGAGTHIIVSDGSGVELANLVTGKTEALGDSGGGTGIYVRQGNATQSFLARAAYALEPQLGAWLMQGVLSINAARLLSVTVTPPAGAPVTVQRQHISDQNYALAGAPPERTNPTAVNGLAAAILDFSIADVRAVAQVDFARPTLVAARTFDGVTVNMALVRLADGVWARVSASAAPDAVTAFKQEAAAITARSAPWAYKLGPEQGRALMAGRDEFLAPAAGGPG